MFAHSKFWIFDCQKNQPGNRIQKLRLGMARVMSVDAFWQQSFPPALAPAGERGAPAFGLHACAKAVLTFAGAFGWLVRAFHKSER
jgi:hypothetical protein